MSTLSSTRTHFENWYLIGRILAATKTPMKIERLHVFFAAIQRKWFEKYHYISRYDEQFFFTENLICVKSIVDAIEKNNDEIFSQLFVAEGTTIALREGMEDYLFTEDYDQPLAVSGYASEALIDFLADCLPPLLEMDDEKLLGKTLGEWNPQALECWITWKDYIIASDLPKSTKEHIIEDNIQIPSSMDKMFASL